MRILLTGATGFVGTALSKSLLEDGHELVILTRNKNTISQEFINPKIQVFEWRDTNSLPPVEAIQGINGVINLMGENIAAKKWTDDQKKVLENSRVPPTIYLTTILNQSLNSPLEFFISTSAIGYYPVNTDDTLNEDSLKGIGFLSNLCSDWEAAAQKIKQTKRTVIIRTGVVLEKNGGALAKMLLPFKLGLGGPIGDGNHSMSWIHLEDLVRVYKEAAMNTNYNGIYNACAPNPVTNTIFTKALGTALHRPTIFPLPAQVLKMMFGEMSSIILDSQIVISKRLSEHFFIFKYDTIEKAFNKIFEK